MEGVSCPFRPWLDGAVTEAPETEVAEPDCVAMLEDPVELALDCVPRVEDPVVDPVANPVADPVEPVDEIVTEGVM